MFEGHPQRRALQPKHSFHPFSKKLQAGISKCHNSLKTVDIIVKHHHSKAHNASNLVSNLSRFAIAFLKKGATAKNKFQQLKNIVHKTLTALGQQNRYLGVCFGFSGRVYGAKKASSFKMLLGSVPFNTLEANIDYANIMQKTRNGT